MAGIWHVPFNGRGISGHATQNFLWQDGPVYIMDNHRSAWWCWLRHLPAGESIDVFHIDRHTDTLGSNLPLWLAALPSQMRGVSIKSYLSFKANVNGFLGVAIRWDNYLSLFFEHERGNLGSVYFATHHDGDAPNLPKGSWIDVAPWDLPKNLGYWLEQGDNWLFNIDLDYFFCNMDSGDCRRFLDSAYVKDMCASIKKNLSNGRIKVLTICLTPDESGFSGGWASSEALCSEICVHLGIEFSLP